MIKNVFRAAFPVSLLLALLLAGCSSVDESHFDDKASITPESLQEGLGEVMLLDVRSQGEYEVGHIDSALNLPLDLISESKLARLGIKKKGPLIVYATSDLSAKKAQTLLFAMDYPDVRVLRGGISHWEEDGFPTVKGSMDVAFVDEATPSSALRIAPPDFDFGIVDKYGGNVSTTFSVENTGNSTVRIEAISTTCGCTTANVSKEDILPGETVSLAVEFNPNFHEEPKDRFSRMVFLETSEGIELEARIYVQIKEG